MIRMIIIQRNIIIQSPVIASRYGYKYENTFERIGLRTFFSKNAWNSGDAKKETGSARGCFFILFCLDLDIN